MQLTSVRDYIGKTKTRSMYVREQRHPSKREEEFARNPHID